MTGEGRREAWAAKALTGRQEGRTHLDDALDLGDVVHEHVLDAALERDGRGRAAAARALRVAAAPVTTSHAHAHTHNILVRAQPQDASPLWWGGMPAAPKRTRRRGREGERQRRTRTIILSVTMPVSASNVRNAMSPPSSCGREGEQTPADVRCTGSDDQKRLGPHPPARSLHAAPRRPPWSCTQPSACSPLGPPTTFAARRRARSTSRRSARPRLPKGLLHHT